MQLKISLVLFLFLFHTSFGLKTVDEPVRGKSIHTPGIKAKVMDNKFVTLYQELTGESKPSFKIFKKALTGFINLKAQGELSKKNLLTIIDYSLSSNKKRLWVIDLDKKDILYHNLVAHGRNTGNLMAEEFSNQPNSNMSSIGFYVTANTYSGKHGLSLRLKGMEEEFNSAAMERAIVMHCADYVSKDFIARYGRLGRSLGCPSLPQAVGKKIIETIAEQTCLFINGPVADYEEKSLLLNKDRALASFASGNVMF